MATTVTVTSPPVGGGDITLEEDTVVGASYKAAAMGLASRAAAEACSSLRTRVMARTRVRALAAFFSMA
jgi:hypothetical protein